METDNWLGCGVATHNPECLCDVVIPEGTDTSIKIKDAVHDMWMGAEICELRGYSAPWTNETILDYFTDQIRFYEAWSASLGREDDGSGIVELWQVPIPQLDMAPNNVSRWKLIRDSVMYCMNRFDDSIADILKHLLITPSMFIEAACTSGKGVKRTLMTIQELENFDRLFMTPNLTENEIASRTGETRWVVRGLSKYWAERRKRSPLFSHTTARKMKAKMRFQQLCLTTHLNSTEIIETMLSEFGILYSKSAIHKYRTRNGYKVFK